MNVLPASQNTTSKQALHTPGPWRVEQDIRGNLTLDILAKDEGAFYFVANVDCREDPEEEKSPPREEALANAALMAAAPDLKDGCNALIGLIQLVCARDDMPPEIKKALLCSHRMDEALAALTKAEGHMIPQPDPKSAPHTPTPWKAICRELGPDDRLNDCVVVSPDGDDLLVLYTNDGADDPKWFPFKANAEFIVQAVNCHTDLVEALKHAISVIEAHVPQDAMGMTGCSTEEPWPLRDEYLHHMRAALAKAGQP